MKLFVGLGNPGAKYARNRHNVGAMAVERIAEAHAFGPFRAKFQGRLAEGRLGSEKVLALLPETYMNRSGDAVQAAVRFYKLAPGDVVVFHDELDLPPGKLRVKSGGGHAGHNGLRSVSGQIGADFTRVRLGIGHPGDKGAVTAWVLGDFSKAEREVLAPLLDAVAEAAPALAGGDGGRFMNAVAATRTPPPAKAPQRGSAPSAESDTAGDGRSLIERLVDRFR